MSAKNSKQSGVTLIELVISIVILSFAVVAVMNAFSVSMRHSADPLWRNKTLKLAQLYFDEILAKNYDHNTPVGGVPVVSSPSCAGLGPEAGETRASYNDVDDYNGYGVIDANDARPTILTGAALDSSYDNYTVTVAVECHGTEVAATADEQAKRVTLTITPPGESAAVFAAYKGNF